MAAINDVVLIYLEDSPVSFARVENILPDHKKDWFQIKLLMLQIPLQVVTWILKDIYINGEEFQMNGKKMRLEPIKAPAEEPAVFNGGKKNTQEHPLPDADTPKQNREKGKIISFADLKKKNHGQDPG